jgi:hypothetical protein
MFGGGIIWVLLTLPKTDQRTFWGFTITLVVLLQHVAGNLALRTYGSEVETRERPQVSPSRRKGTSGRYTRKEVAEHHSPDDLWLVVDKWVYDVTTFASDHPGGAGILEAK